MSATDQSIALCRVSTAEQALTGHSLERQGQNVLRAAEALGAPVARTWSLDQSSKAGKNLKRKDLGEMIAFCKASRRVKYLIVDEVDRFMRSIDEFYYFEVQFRQVGVTVWYASQPELNSDNMMAKLQKLLMIFQAEASNSERVHKSNNGLRERVRLGYYPFPVPQGYRKTGEPGLFEPDGPRFRLLQEAFREILAGTPPAAALRRLTLRGYTTPADKVLGLKRFMEILRCPYYAGAIRVKGWDTTNDHGLHRRMVALDEFERLQQILDGKRLKEPRRAHNPDYPLSNLMACAECGGQLVGMLHRNGKGGAWPKYRCRGCGRLHRREDVHAGVDELLAGVRVGGERKSLLVASLERTWRQEQSEALGHVRALETRVGELREDKRRFLRALAENPDLRDAYAEAIAEVDGKIREAEREAADARKVDDDLVEFVKFALGFVEGQSGRWWLLEHESRLGCKLLLFPRGFLVDRREKVYTPEISPLIRLNGTKTGPLNGPVDAMVDLTVSSLHPLLEEIARWRELLMTEYQRYRLAK